MYNLRFRWWCRRLCKYVSRICYHGNRHSVSRCNGMAGAVLLARSSFHSDSASQLPMQGFVCLCVLHEYGVTPVWVECSLAYLAMYDLLCNVWYVFHPGVIYFYLNLPSTSPALSVVSRWPIFIRYLCVLPFLSLFLSPYLCLLRIRVLKLIRVNRCCGCYLCFHLVWLSYKLSTGPAQCRRSA